MHDNDQEMRNLAASLPLPDFGVAAFSKPPPLREARVAIVTSAALTLGGEVSKRQDEKWAFVDYNFETLPNEARDLELSHISPNFDRSGFAADLNVVYPVDRL